MHVAQIFVPHRRACTAGHDNHHVQAAAAHARALLAQLRASKALDGASM